MKLYHCGLLFFHVAWTSVGGAQEPAAPDSVRYKLAPVKVRTTRTTAAPLETPASATVVGAEELRNADAPGLDRALAAVPGVVAQSRAGGSDVRIVIRGFGARGAGDRSNSGTSRGIRVLLDGIPETEPDGRTSFDLIDLASIEAIEVVRSNASALWGNAAGGVVNISTVPSFIERFASVQQTVGGFGLSRTTLRAGTPSGRSRIAVTALHSRFDGWREHSEHLRTLINIGMIAPFARRSEAGIFAAAARNYFEIPGPLTPLQFAVNPREANSVYQARDERRLNSLGRLGAIIRHGVGAEDEMSAMAFITPKVLRRSERNTYREFDRYHLGGNGVYRRRTRFGAALPGTMLAGIDAAHQDGAVRFYNLSATNDRGDTLRVDQREGSRNVGIFVQQELEFGSRTRLLLGVRQDAITYHNRDLLEPSLDARKTFAQLTPKVGLNYRLSGSHSVFASVGGGVEAPAGNETDPASTFGQDTVTSINPLLDPVRSTTYEVGTKQVLTSGRGTVLSYDAAAYHTDVRNEIVPYRGGRFYFTAGRARRAGVELGTRVQAANGLSLQSALTWSDNRYVHYTVDSVHYGNPGRLADFSGNRVVGVPDFLYSATVGLKPSRWPKLLLQAGVQGNDGYFADDANRITVPRSATITATASINEPIVFGNGMTARGFVTVTNLWNRQYVASAFLNPDIVNGQPMVYEAALPRDFQLSIQLGWGR